MRVIIPVAGSGTRLRPHTYATQKALLPVANRPILDHIVEPISKLDVEECIFVVGHLGEQIREHVKTNYRMPTVCVEQERLLGLGYAVYQALREMEPGPTLVVLGDTIAHCDLPAFVAGDRSRLGVCEVDDPQRFGIAEVDKGRIIRLEEKPQQPKSNLALIGLYYFQDSRVLFDNLEKLVKSGKTTRGEIQLTDALAMMLETGVDFEPFEVSGWFDCGQKDAWLQTNRHLIELADDDSKDAEKLTMVASSARVTDSELGPNVAVGEMAVIRDSRLRNCIVDTRAVVENADLVDSIVGAKAVIRNVKGSINIGPTAEVEGSRD